MDVKALNKRIDAFKTRNTKLAQDLHDLGMLCLEHLAAHNDTMPLNRLVLALVRGQHQPFGSWCMAFGAVVRTNDKKKAETQPLSFAKDKATDLAGAVMVSLASAAWNLCAWARKPCAGLLSKILMKPA